MIEGTEMKPPANSQRRHKGSRIVSERFKNCTQQRTGLFCVVAGITRWANRWGFQTKKEHARNSRCHPLTQSLGHLTAVHEASTMCQGQSWVSQTEMLLVFVVGQNPSCYSVVVVWKVENFKSFVSERKCG